MFAVKYWNKDSEQFETLPVYRNRRDARKAGKNLKATGLAKRYRVKQIKKQRFRRSK